MNSAAHMSLTRVQYLFMGVFSHYKYPIQLSFDKCIYLCDANCTKVIKVIIFLMKGLAPSRTSFSSRVI